MGKRLLLLTFILINFTAINAQIVTSISDPSASISGEGTNNITIQACGPVTFSIGGTILGPSFGSNLHAVVITSSSGTPGSSDPNFTFWSGGTGACNPLVAPAGFYYNAAVVSGWSAPPACMDVFGDPLDPSHNYADTWGAQVPINFEYEVVGLSGSCGDSESISINMYDGSVYGGGGIGSGSYAGTITINIVSTTPSITGSSSLTIDCNSPEIASPTEPNVVGCSGGMLNYSESGNTPNCNGYTITRTWTYTNDCGVSATPFVQTITVNPVPDPGYSVPSLPASIACGSAASYNPPSISYNNSMGGGCSISGTATGSATVNAASCGGTIDVVWMVPDGCGVLQPVTASITISPPSNPSWSASPTNVILSCGDPIPGVFGPLNYTNGESGSCEVSGTASPNISGSIDPCTGGTLTYTWSETPSCGTLPPLTATITVLPIPDPTWNSTPASVSLNCGDAIPASFGDISYTNGLSGSCEVSGTVSPTTSGTIDPCIGGTITYTWTPNPSCGTLAPLTATITVLPTPDPVWDATPSSITLNCGDAIPASFGDISYTNGLSGGCEVSGTVSPTTSGTIDPCTGGTITYTWTPNPSCGSLAPLTATITVLPTPDPVWDATPASVTLNCGDAIPASFGDISYTNGLSGGCEVSGTVSPTTSGTIDPCTGGTITYTWTPNPSCGTLAPLTATVTVLPTPDPVWDATPSSVTLNCGDAIPASFGDISYTNSLSGGCEVSGTVSPTTSGTIDPCTGGTITYTWTPNPSCGTLAPLTATVTVLPTPDPVWDATPASVTLNCGDAIPASFGDISYTNGLSGGCEVSGTVSPTTSGTIDPCTGGTITYTWTPNPSCGTLAPLTATVTVLPTPDPVWDATPASVTLNCGDAIPASFGDISYTNGLSGGCEVSGTVSPTTSGTIDPCTGGTITYTWTPNPSCGTLAPLTATVTVLPTPDPVWASTPTSVTLNCGDAIPASFGDISYTNGLSGGCEVSGTVSPTTSGTIDPCTGGTITYTWTPNPSCGTLAPLTATVTVLPTPDPVWASTPASVTLNCGDAIPASFGDISYANGLSGSCEVSGTVSPTTSGTIDPCTGGTITYTWTPNPSCGTLAPLTATVTVLPTPDPVWASTPASVTLNCGDAIPASFGDISYANGLSGSCEVSGTVSPTTSGSIDPCNGGTITYTWTPNPSCGTLAPLTATITVLPAPDPSWATSPTNVTLNCGDAIPSSFGDISFSNGLSGSCEISGTVSPNISGSIDPCSGGTLTYTWTPSLSCGTLAPLTATITVLPAPNPTWSVTPNSVTLNCGDTYPASFNDITYSNGLSGSCEISGTVAPNITGSIDPCNGGTLTYTWTPTPGCGTLSTLTATITVLPAPNASWLSAPADITLSCGDAIPASFGDLSYSNGLSGSCGINGSVSPNISGSADPCTGGTVTYTWSASASCGSISPHNASITFQPVPEPYWYSSLPGNQTISCSDVSTYLAGLQELYYSNGASGSCDISGYASPINDYNSSISCGGNFEVSWQLPSACGGFPTYHRITVTLIDAESPTFNIPSDVTLNCGDDYTNAALTGGSAYNLNDNCTASPVELAPQFIDVTPNGSCDKRYNKIFTVTDDCGNTSTRSQLISINASSSANWDNTPTAVLSIECETDLPALQNLNYSGGCAVPGSITPIENRTGFSNGRCGIIIRTWTPPNQCGVPTPFIQTIYIEPTIAPVFIDPPADVTLDCDESVPDPTNLVMVLSCTGNQVVTPSVTNGTNQVTYTWSYNGSCAVDNITHQQRITIPETIKFTLEAPDEICAGTSLSVSDIDFYDNTTTGDLVVSYYVNSGRTTPFNSQVITEETTIYVRVNNALGCYEDDVVVVGVIPAVNAGADITAQYCGQETVDLNALLTTGATSGGEFIDINGSFTTITNGIANLSGLTPGTYFLKYSVNGNQSCEGDEANLSIEVLGKPQMVVNSKQCATDLQTYGFEVQVSGSFSQLLTSVGTIQDLGNGRFRVFDVPKDQDVQLTATGQLANCDEILTVVKANCACSDIPEPVPANNNAFVCFNSTNPTLEVTGIETANKALWYSDAGLTNLVHEGTTFTPSNTAVGVHEFYVIQEAPGNCFSDPVKVSFEIKPLPVVNAVRIELCDDDFDGKALFNLTSRRGAINAVPGNTVSYYTSFQDATDGINPIIDSMQFMNTVIDSQLIYTRTVNVNQCVSVGQFKLVVNKLPEINLKTTDVACLGGNNGKVEISLNNQISSPQYKLTSTPYGSVPMFENLTAGTDTVFVRSAKSCVSKMPFTIQDGIKLTATRIDYSCNDNNTKTIPGDDIATIKLLITGGSGKYIVKENNIVIGEYDYDTEASLPGRPANGSSGSLTIEDKIAGCPITVNFGPLNACSSDCTIDANLSSGVCDNAGTPTNPADDKINFTLTASSQNGGAIAKVSIDGGPTTDYVYGSSMPIVLPADGQTHTIKLVDILKPACVTEIVTNVLLSCSDECVIVNESPLAICSNNGTDSDANDDTFDAIIKISAQNSSSTFFTIQGIPGNFDYGTTHNLGTFPISGGDKSFVITDGNTKCSQTIRIKAPASCSSTCKLSVESYTELCNNNNTPLIPGDDFYDLSLTVKQINGSVSGYEIFIDGISTGSGEYGKKLSLKIPADGLSHQLRFVDKSDANCSLDLTTTTLTSCSNECKITAKIQVSPCDNGGTYDNDITDDTYSFTITPEGENTVGDSWQFELLGTLYEGKFGESVTISALKITDGNPKITITTTSGNVCPTEFTIQAPPPCSNPCDIEIVNLEIGSCSNNNTGTNTTDDYFSVSFQVSGTETGLTKFKVTIGDSIYGIFDYNQLVLIEGLPADNSDIRILVQDTSTNKSFCNTYVTVSQTPCSQCLGTVDAGVSQTITCANPEIELTANAINTLEFIWNGPGITDQKSQSIKVTNAGTYYVKAVFEFGCEAIDSVVISKDANIPGIQAGQDFTLNCEITSTNLTAIPDRTGAGITYEWKNAAGQVLGTGLSLTDINVPGKYTVKISDASTGCSSTDEVEIFKNDHVPAAVIISDPANVIDCKVQVINLSAQVEQNATYFWISSVHQMDQTPTIVVNQPGMVKLIVIDTISKCQNDASMMIEDGEKYPQIELLDPAPLTCKNFEVTLDASGSLTNSQIRHTWLDALGQQIGSGLTHSVTQAGQYIFISEDINNGCINSDTIQVEDIGERFDFELVTKELEVNCNDQRATLQLSVEGPASDYNITWTSGKAGNTIDQSDPLLPKINGAGQYFVTIINKKNDCEVKADARIYTPVDLPEIKQLEITNETCFEDENGTINLTSVEGGTLPYTVKLNGQIIGSTFQSGLKPGIYMIEVQDQKGCETDSMIQIKSGNDIKIDMPISLSVDVGEEIILKAEVNVADTLIKDYYWSPADLVDCVNCFETRCLVLADNDFIFTIIDINGCLTEQTTEVRVRLVPKIHVPNIISLSSFDNDAFLLTTEYVKNIKEFQIFDRWGNAVYQKKDFSPNEMSEAWRGTTMNGREVSTGVYAYRVLAELTTPYIDKSGKTVTEIQQVGDVTVIK